MTTYSIRCRNAACRHRRVSGTHPEGYKVVPRCAVCGKRVGWRIENREYNKRNLCKCDGPEMAFGRWFPHRTTHPLCDNHPHGFYNQARARGVAHEDIPERYQIMLVKENEGTHSEDRWVLSSLLRSEIVNMTDGRKADFLAELVEMLVEKDVLSAQQVGNLVYRNLSPDIDEADE